MGSLMRIQLQNRIPLQEVIPLSTPFTLFIDPCGKCNFKCEFCYHSACSNKNFDLMDFNIYKKIINDAGKFEEKFKVIRLYGFGEPLLNNSFVEMVKYAKESGCCERVDTTTNGSLLNKKLNLKIIDAGLDRINISIEGVTSGQYQKFSKIKLDFNKFVYNIKHFFDNKKQCFVFVKINEDALSKEDKRKFIDIFSPICDELAFEHTMQCWGREVDVDVNTQVGIYGQPLQNVQTCPYIFYSLMIQSSGEVSLCFLDWDKKRWIGDVKHQSLKEIWGSKILRSYQVQMLSRGKCSIEECKDCSQLTHGYPVDLDKYSKELLKKF
jgi:MoaA/NifB/PqqE/SkfB family radical SAM enzyme